MKKLFLKNVTSHFYLFIFILFTCSFLACGSEAPPETTEDTMLLTEAETMLLLVNKARLDEGLKALVLNDTLNEVAYNHSLEMDINNYFSHTGLNGSSFSDRVTLAGYTGFPLAENIAKGQQTTEATFNGWMDSDGHRTNILKTNATEMGLGVSGVSWTQIFGIAE